MKLLGRCTGVRCYCPRYHPPHYGCHPKFFCISSRKMAVGLFFVSAKPFALHPSAPASMAINNLLKEANQQLQMYDVMQDHTQRRLPRLALSLIDDLAKVKEGAHMLQSLPQQPKDSTDDASETRGRSESPREETSDNDGPELPPELQPILQDDGFSPLPDGEEAIWDNSDTPHDYDAFDLKNTPDFDPDQDHEAEFYTNDIVDAWIKADEEECTKGAKPRLYERMNIPNETKSTIYSKNYDTSPINRGYSSSPAPSKNSSRLSLPQHRQTSPPTF